MLAKLSGQTKKFPLRTPMQINSKVISPLTSGYLAGFTFSESIQNSIRKEKKKVYENLYYYYDVYVDGTKVDWEIEAGQLYGEYLERTTQQLYVCTEEGSDRAGWQKLVNNLKPGVHQIKV
jgi:hypothetical protein